MVLNRFKVVVFIQIVLIALVSMLISLSLGREYMLMTTTGLLLLWVGQILYLSFYMNRIHRDVRKFMDALKNQDTTQLFNHRRRGNYFNKLYASFNEITRNFRLVRIEKEVENQFIRETIEQSASGIIALTEDKKVRLINASALKILGLDYLGNLSELRKAHPDLASLLETGTLGAHHVKIQVKRKMVHVAVKASEMNLDGSPVRIFSLLDISGEINRSEVEAWQKLIRVLNHEITNSVVPLHMLSTSLLDLFHDGKQQKEAKDLNDEQIDRAVLGLKTIMKRSGGLKDFMDTYRSYSEPGNPLYSKILISELFRQVCSLFEEELMPSGISLNQEIAPAHLQLVADVALIEQTLINLVKNSIFALEGRANPEIRLKAFQEGEQVFIEIRDNGKGIPDELREQIFIPFFTTRKEGSGIGLSLARQVMLSHKGAIHVDSEEGEFTSITLIF